jgi:hypothetical protein
MIAEVQHGLARPASSYSIGQLYAAGRWFSSRPTSEGYTYCLTAANCFIGWPEVIFIPDGIADTQTTGWISRFSFLETITTNQGRQSHNSSSPWPKYVEFSFPGQQPTTPQPTDLCNVFIRH